VKQIGVDWKQRVQDRAAWAAGRKDFVEALTRGRLTEATIFGNKANTGKRVARPTPPSWEKRDPRGLPDLKGIFGVRKQEFLQKIVIEVVGDSRNTVAYINGTARGQHQGALLLLREAAQLLSTRRVRKRADRPFLPQWKPRAENSAPDRLADEASAPGPWGGAGPPPNPCGVAARLV